MNNIPSRCAEVSSGLAQRGKVSGVVLLLLIAAGGSAIWWWKHKQADRADVHAASAGSGGGSGRRSGAGQGPQPVSVMAVSRRDIRVQASAIGTFAASSTAVVHAQVSGVLQKLNFVEGQQVVAGQTLAQIDPRAFQASLNQAEGTLIRDKAQLDNARLDLDRYRGLLAKDALSQQQVDTQLALVRQLEGTVRADQASVDAARLQLGYTRVLAPIAGRVGLKQVDVGNVVQQADANGIVSITQTRPMALVFAVPSGVLPKIMAGLKARQVLPVQALDRNSREVLARGRVSTIDNAMDAATDTIKVKALFDNTDDTLFPNQAVSVALQVDTLHDVLAVPPAAVLRGTKGYYVYVVGADNKVITRVIKPGAVDGNWMAIEGAIQPGESVVIDGVDRLREGAKVEVIPTDPTQRAGASGSPAGSERRNRLPPEVAEKIKAMNPDERRAWFQQHRGEYNKASGAAN